MKPFYVAYAGILQNEKSEVLLLQRSAHSNTNPFYWEPPGGKPEESENLSSALSREIFEETGYLIQISHPIGTGMQELEDKKVAYLIMACKITGGKFQLSAEHSDFRWLVPEKVISLPLAPQFISFFRGCADEYS